MRILAVADVENDELIKRLEQRDADRRYDLVISCGDLSMSYLDCVATLANAPLFYVRGNHDIGYDNDPHLGGTNLDGRVERFCGLRISGLEGSLDYREGIVGYSQSEMRHRVVALGLRAALTGGYVARRTKTESELGAKLDSAADLALTAVCLAKVLSTVAVPAWLWAWVAAIAVVKMANAVSGS